MTSKHFLVSTETHENLSYMSETSIKDHECPCFQRSGSLDSPCFTVQLVFAPVFSFFGKLKVVSLCLLSEMETNHPDACSIIQVESGSFEQVLLC